MPKKRGLGFGLSGLLSDINSINSCDKNHKASLRHLSVDLLKPGKYQPRRDMDKNALSELADSIRTQGIIQPIIVRSITNSHYEIIAGERRWRAAQLAHLHEVPVVIREISDEQAIALSLIENIQREDLNAIDTAVGLQRLIDEFSMTHESAASAVGKSRTTITNLLRLLELPEEVKRMVQHNQLEMGHARALLTLEMSKQLVAANIIFSKRLSVRAAEILVRQLQQPQAVTRISSNPDMMQLQKNIADKLAASVNIFHSKTGKGKIIIKYNNLSELNSILKHIR